MEGAVELDPAAHYEVNHHGALQEVFQVHHGHQEYDAAVLQAEFETEVPETFTEDIRSSELITGDGVTDGEDSFNSGFVPGFSQVAGGSSEPVPEEAEPETTEEVEEEEVVEDRVGAAAEELDYKKRYRAVKAEFRVAVETHEYLRSELKSYQRQLQTLQEDKFFLLERMLLYEKPPESPESNEGSDSDGEPGQAKKAKLSNGGVTIASAFSKIKSFSSGRKSRKTKTKCFEDVFESPSDSLGTFEDESTGMGSSRFSYPTQDDSD